MFFEALNTETAGSSKVDRGLYKKFADCLGKNRYGSIISFLYPSTLNPKP